MIQMLGYRGEHGINDTKNVCHSRQTAIYFCSRDVAVEYSRFPNLPTDVVKEPKLIKAILSMNKPFIVEPRDPYLEIGTLIERLGKDEAIRIALKFEKSIAETDFWRECAASLSGDKSLKQFLDSPRMKRFVFPELYFQAFHFFDDNEEVAKLVALGYDGAVHRGNAASEGSQEYCVFNESCIRPLEYNLTY